MLRRLLVSTHSMVGACFAAALLLTAGTASAQVIISGFGQTPRFGGQPGGTLEPITATFVFGSRPGAANQTLAARTFETAPSGWYYMTGNAGVYSLLMIPPMNLGGSPVARPAWVSSLNLPDLTVLGNQNFRPLHDMQMLDTSSWDATGAVEYYQVFQAVGPSLTSVSFRLAHDGIDGGGPGSRTMLMTVHHDPGSGGSPDGWTQVGPSRLVYNVNAGGSFSPVWSAGWITDELPLVPGDWYAVRIRNDGPDSSFIPFWGNDGDADTECYKVGGGTAWTGKDIWMLVGTDDGDLLIPYQKCIQRGPTDLTQWATAWEQTWVAKGRGLAGGMLYIALPYGGEEKVKWHRAIVRVREGGPSGPLVGLTKLARGVDWATAEVGPIGFSCRPGEIPLTPGQTYSIEFESINGGFNPFRKDVADTYPDGAAHLGGRARTYDLEMILVEYTDPAEQVVLPETPPTGMGPNLALNGDMEGGTPSQSDGHPDDWQIFEVDPGSVFWYGDDFGRDGSRGARIIGGSISGNTVDGGFVQQVNGLTVGDDYRLSAWVQTTWAVGEKHVTRIGWDPTGQTTEPDAATIEWVKAPDVHDMFQQVILDVTTTRDRGSIWLRGATTQTTDRPYTADFDDVILEPLVPVVTVPDTLETR